MKPSGVVRIPRDTVGEYETQISCNVTRSYATEVTKRFDHRRNTMTAHTLPILVPDAVSGMESRRRIKKLHNENLDRLRAGEPVSLPDAGEDEDSLSGRALEYHELTKEEIRRHGRRVGGEDGLPRYRLSEEDRHDIADLTEKTVEKVETQNTKVYIAAFVIGVLVFGPVISFMSYVF